MGQVQANWKRHSSNPVAAGFAAAKTAYCPKAVSQGTAWPSPIGNLLIPTMDQVMDAIGIVFFLVLDAPALHSRSTARPEAVFHPGGQIRTEPKTEKPIKRQMISLIAFLSQVLTLAKQ